MISYGYKSEHYPTRYPYPEQIPDKRVDVETSVKGSPAIAVTRNLESLMRWRLHKATAMPDPTTWLTGPFLRTNMTLGLERHLEIFPGTGTLGEIPGLVDIGVATLTKWQGDHLKAVWERYLRAGNESNVPKGFPPPPADFVRPEVIGGPGLKHEQPLATPPPRGNNVVGRRAAVNVQSLVDPGAEMYEVGPGSIRTGGTYGGYLFSEGDEVFEGGADFIAEYLVVGIGVRTLFWRKKR